MKPILRFSALVAIIASLASCGFPTMAVRSATNTVREVGGLANGSSSAYSDGAVAVRR